MKLNLTENAQFGHSEKLREKKKPDSGKVRPTLHNMKIKTEKTSFSQKGMKNELN